MLTWPLAIARNRAIDLTRRRTSEPLDPELVAARLELARPGGADVEAPARLHERETIRDALAGLPATQRRALVLAVYLGRTAGEISELDGVALGTVKWRIRQAMLRLREESKAPMSARSSCEEVRALAPELALGIADGKERAEALAHLASCAACRGYLAELTDIADDLLALAPAAEPPVGFETRVLAELGIERAEPTRRLPWPRRRPRRAVLVAAARA